MLAWLEEAVGQVLSWALLVVVLVQVVDRFFFAGGLQLAWTEEIARLLLVWYVFWGCVLVEAEHSHIRVDLVERILPDRMRSVVTRATFLAVAGLLFVLMAYAAIYAVHERDSRLPATGFPRSVFVAAVVVCSALMLFHVLLGFVRRARFAPTSSEATAE